MNDLPRIMSRKALFQVSRNADIKPVGKFDAIDDINVFFHGRTPVFDVDV